MAKPGLNPVKRILKILRFQKKDISAIYFYAILNGLVQLSLPLGIQSIVSFVLGGAISTSIVILIILVVLGVFLNGLFQVNQMKLIEKIEQQVFVRFSFEYAQTLPRLNLKSVDGYFLPELTNRFFDISTLQKGLAKLLLDFPTATIQILFGLILLSFYHPIFILFSLVFVTVVYFIIRMTSGKGLATSVEESNYKYEVGGWLEEIARVVTNFKFSRDSTLHLQRTDKIVTRYLDARTRHFRILKLQYWALIGFKIAITAAMLIVGSVLLVDQQLNIGQFVAAEIIILLVINSVEKLIINIDNVYDILTSVEKLEKVTDQPLEKEGKIELVPAVNGVEIAVNNMSFSYREGQPPVLNNISFNLNPGEKVQIMGVNGSGKSTLIKVLSGAYQPFDGTITYNSIPLEQYNFASFRSKTGIFLSTQELFDGTLFENLTMGNDRISMEEIMRLSEVVGLRSFLKNSKKGLEMMINPMGERLPKKIVHKLLLLRALINSPSLLLLEEPWLGLESEYAQRIKDYLLREMPATTGIIVSNDPEFATHCSKVIFMEDGNIRHIGTWNEIKGQITNDNNGTR
ncbi:MAG: ATP-binding cassette domain-containing protein [Flavipsychrobacter sp.]|nr:ATP-binding cassette domain-containing protein [Flavipsychrobacter sp.]